MFAFLRWLVSIALFHASLSYAAFVTLSVTLNSSRYPCSEKLTAPKRRAAAKDSDEDECRFNDTAASLSSSSSSSQMLTEEEAQLYALKLWLMLTTLASLSQVGTDSLPFFLEFRTLACWMIVFMEPRAHGLMYDRTFHPMLRRIGGWLSALQSKQVMSRIVLLALRGLTSVAVSITNAADKRGFLEEEAVHDLMGGLAFTLRALDDARVFSPVTVAANRGESFKTSSTANTVPSAISGSSGESNAAVQWIVRDDGEEETTYIGRTGEERKTHNSNHNSNNHNIMSDGLRYRRSATEGYTTMRASDPYGSDHVRDFDAMSAEEVVAYKGSAWEEKPVEKRKKRKHKEKSPSVRATFSEWMGNH